VWANLVRRWDRASGIGGNHDFNAIAVGRDRHVSEGIIMRAIGRHLDNPPRRA
jgi:hypothetical protein